MKKLTNYLIILFTFVWGTTLAQTEEPTPQTWEFSTDANFYLIPDDFIFLPVFCADKNKLHLEARYNYEDIETFSVWTGYNFSGGKKIEYTITPMAGGVVGNSNGIAPGLEFIFTLNKFELYNESEYFIDLEYDNHFFYSWVDFTYSPTDWLWLGISGQRTRLYQTELEIQRGLLIGAGYKSFELSTYLYNPGNDPFVILSLSATF